MTQKKKKIFFLCHAQLKEQKWEKKPGRKYGSNILKKSRKSKEFQEKWILKATTPKRAGQGTTLRDVGF